MQSKNAEEATDESQNVCACKSKMRRGGGARIQTPPHRKQQEKRRFVEGKVSKNTPTRDVDYDQVVCVVACVVCVVCLVYVVFGHLTHRPHLPTFLLQHKTRTAWRIPCTTREQGNE